MTQSQTISALADAAREALEGDMRAEAAHLRALPAELDAEAQRIGAKLPALDAEFERLAATWATAGTYSDGMARGTELNRQRGDIRARLRRIDEERAQADRRLRQLDAMLEAQPRAEAARDSYVAAVREEREARQLSDDHRVKLAALDDQADAHAARGRAAGANLRSGRAAALLHQVGIGAGAADGEPLDAAAHEAEGKAIAEAREIAASIAAQLHADCAKATERAGKARTEFAVAMARVEELQHAAALAVYLPALARLRGAQSIALGHTSSPPDLVALVGRDAVEAASVEFRASIDAITADAEGPAPPLRKQVAKGRKVAA